jgi:hypothetical protein
MRTLTLSAMEGSAMPGKVRGGRNRGSLPATEKVVNVVYVTVEGYQLDSCDRGDPGTDVKSMASTYRVRDGHGDDAV